MDAVLRLLAGAVGEPDDRERRQIGRDEVRLDLDPPRLEADDGGGEGACEHASDATVGTRDVSVPTLCRKGARLRRSDSARGGDEDRLVVLAGAPTGAAIDVPLVAVDEAQPGPPQDLRDRDRAGR